MNSLWQAEGGGGMTAKDYEVVMGLEVHVELGTETKIFCGCSTAFGAPPNTQVCRVCLGLPGALPVLNEKVVDYAIKAGIATNCEITPYGKQDRKNYFYPDLPKAYQISQYDLPLCRGGYIDIEVQGETRRIGITRIHIEEDAGKLIHDGGGTLIDYNRGGVPLIEIVSEPDLRTAEEVSAYLRKLRAILLYAGISECRMNEGAFRCDVNLSVRPKGSGELGTRTEMKNLNSFNFIQKAIEHETQRQIALVMSGGKVVQETRRWDQSAGKSVSMRTKEDAHDYRYFPDPDLMPIVVTGEKISKLQAELPQLPDERKAHYIHHYGLGSYDAEQLVASRALADYFEKATVECTSVKLLANLMTTEVFRLLGEQESEGAVPPFEPAAFAALVNRIEDETIHMGIGKKVLTAMWAGGGTPDDIIETQDLKQISDEAVLLPIVEEVVLNHEKAVSEYLQGKEKALQSLVGQIMAKTKGKANPRKVNALLEMAVEKAKKR